MMSWYVIYGKLYKLDQKIKSQEKEKFLKIRPDLSWGTFGKGFLYILLPNLPQDSLDLKLSKFRFQLYPGLLPLFVLKYLINKST
jgi:hypothetical protein